MTEEEAKTKWCPYARTHDGDNIAGVNRTYEGRSDVGAHCLGSGCMVWRWKPVKNEAYIPQPSMWVQTTITHPADLVSPWKDSNTEGYCGLAVKP